MDHGTFYSTIEQIKLKRADVSVLRIAQPAIAGAGPHTRPPFIQT